MWSTNQQKEKIFNNLMQLFGLNKATDPLASVNSVH